MMQIKKSKTDDSQVPGTTEPVCDGPIYVAEQRHSKRRVGVLVHIDVAMRYARKGALRAKRCGES
jgi:hypothetical protein